VFGKGAQKAEESAETIEQLHAKIGQLTMENDFLERGLERIHGPRGLDPELPLACMAPR
jgi:cell division protein FtsB